MNIKELLTEEGFIIDFNKNIDRINDKRKELEKELKNIEEYLAGNKKDKKILERKKALIKELKYMKENKN